MLAVSSCVVLQTVQRNAEQLATIEVLVEFHPDEFLPGDQLWTFEWTDTLLIPSWKRF